MKKLLPLLLLLLPCPGGFAQSLSEMSPTPKSVVERKGSCRIAGIEINCDAAFGEDVQELAAAFADRIKTVSGKESTFACPAGLKRAVEKGKIKGMVMLHNAAIPAEGYVLDITPGLVRLEACGRTGILYGLRSIEQLLPAEIYENAPAKGRWSIPCCRISDDAKNAVRPAGLDCSTNFLTAEEVKKRIETMSVFKLNRLYWKLPWPLFPQPGNFYTQEEISAICRFASFTGVEIIAEAVFAGNGLDDAKLLKKGLSEFESALPATGKPAEGEEVVSIDGDGYAAKIAEAASRLW